MTRPDNFYAMLNPGVRRTVRWLHANGFDTWDSGDGETHQYECDRQYPYVVIPVEPMRMVPEAIRLLAALRARGLKVEPLNEESADEPHVLAEYDPTEPEVGLITLAMVTDAVLFKPEYQGAP